MRKLVLVTVTMLFSIATYVYPISLNAQPNKIQRFVEYWCDDYFEGCFMGRTFIEVTDIFRTRKYDDYTEIKGKLTYTNLLGIHQNVSFIMYVYSNRVYLKKQSLQYNSDIEEWEWKWEQCGRKW